MSSRKAKGEAFPKRKNDAYLTWDARAFPALLRELPLATRFVEPCAGRGDIVAHLEAAGRQHRCVAAFDVAPQADHVTKRDAMTLDSDDVAGAECFITNLPWTRPLLHPLLMHLSGILPVWNLLDADWAFTKQAAEYLPHCAKIVAVGRLRWVEGSEHDGTDSCAWYLFDRQHTEGPVFINNRLNCPLR